MARRFELPSAGDRRDREHRVIFLGMVVPAVLALWLVVNLVTRQAVWPVMHGKSLTFVWVTDFLRVSMAAAVKLGIAVACFGWYFMANHDDWNYWAPITAVLGCGIGVVAFVVGSLAFLW
jgi:hypothetical protein